METSVGNSRGRCEEVVGTVANIGKRMGGWHSFLRKIARERAGSSKRNCEYSNEHLVFYSHLYMVAF